MTVHELTAEQFDELRNAYFWSDEAQPKTTATGDFATCPEEIADELIYGYYAGIIFVNDDFFCTAGRENNV